MCCLKFSKHLGYLLPKRVSSRGFKYADAYYGRGLACANKGAPDNAIKDFSKTIALDPKYVFAYSNLAWTRATYPDAQFRDGNEAVSMASKACRLTIWNDRICLGTLAAAYAEQGDFDHAVQWQTKALELTTKEPGKLIGRKRLELYEARKPYREEAKK
jgi:tetratricopeptide (TPR) repeat protein